MFDLKLFYENYILQIVPFSIGIALVSSCENDEGDDKKIDKKTVTLSNDCSIILFYFLHQHSTTNVNCLTCNIC